MNPSTQTAEMPLIYLPSESEILAWLGVEREAFAALPAMSRIAFWRFYLAEGSVIAGRYLKAYFSRLGTESLGRRLAICQALKCDAFLPAQKLEIAIASGFQLDDRLTASQIIERVKSKLPAKPSISRMAKALSSLTEQWLLVEFDGIYQLREGRTKPFRVGQRVIDLRGYRHERRGVISDFQSMQGAGLEPRVTFDGTTAPEFVNADYLSLETPITLEPGRKKEPVHMVQMPQKWAQLETPHGTLRYRKVRPEYQFVSFAIDPEGEVVEHAFALRSHLCAIEALALKMSRTGHLKTHRVVCYPIISGEFHGSSSAA